ncbi:glycosyltransferase family 17 protein [Pholiota molesta]|nr:glycosyltransferase family 17 protein [Pholiota molesta]
MATFFFRRSRSTGVLILAGVFMLLTLYGIVQNQYQLKNLLSYSTRPLWDKNTGPNEIIPHFYSEGLQMDAHTCNLHGFTERREKGNIKVLDAVLMSNELDLLEIRLNELDSVVDYFLIFAKFEHKIVYSFLPGYPLRPGQSPWDVEAFTRNTMTGLIRTHVLTLTGDAKPIVLMSDLDEIPARHTVDLLKNCDFGPSIHLQLRIICTGLNDLIRSVFFSFEWYLGLTSNSYYRHSKSGERVLAEAGYHCSYCFKTIPRFSHADRIADTICKGKDIFGMLPEAYSYVDLLSQMSLQPIGLPRYLIENSEKFRFLLPGGCIRDS